ncbi:aldose epimerase family protein [Fulvivirga lutimaris]|uniref:aldose epimerase family protein n=1 Tax=Fulvivirga lutimaris TaxID=1819566 RepID=UPI0012BBD4E4|nr:aldose epimerase family protein [Fulvivirga lutimaris]MTI38928.1 galactose mutarotase [Fulvivirga lutimaris]
MSSLQTFEITNQQISLKALNLGGIITELLVPDRKGELVNVVLGYNNISDFLSDDFYLGCIAGRFANRVAEGKLTIDGKAYQLAINNGKNHLHGGIKGFNKVYWEVSQVSESKLAFNYTSPHLEEGYPGNLDVTVTYELTEANELVIEYKAITDQETVINLTNHSYFNLSGAENGDILDHTVQIFTDSLVDVNEDQIPTGIIQNVTNTPFDFQEERNLNEAMEEYKSNDKTAIGFDHCYAYGDKRFKQMATVASAASGIAMEVYSTEPGMQLYTGNHLTAPFKQYQALCLETQHYPDSPNQPDFPGTSLKPNEEFNSKTVYQFSNF